MNDKILERLIKIMERIAEGDYNADVMSFTTEAQPEHVRRIAEAMGMMLVKVEAREYQLKENTLHTIQAMAEALGARDPYTRGHVTRVAEYSKLLAKALGMDGDDAVEVWTAGMLHDIGKIGFSDAIFQNEDTRPTPEMLHDIQQHPSIGMNILRQLDFLGPALDYVLKHHEKLDGSGYPNGYTADDIPLGARIVAVADVYDALTTDRPYQKGRTPEEAFLILRKLCPSSLDPEVVEVFARVMQKRRESQEDGA